MILLLVASSASVAYSLPPNAVETEWYDDGTYTNMVGWKFLDCSGDRQSWGIQTDWYKKYSDSCDSGGYSCETCYRDHNDVWHCNYLCP